MDWHQHIDGYCERTDAALWSEPVNAVTNLAFVVVAVWMWRGSAGVPGARMLSVILGMIGIGSFLFHTFATPWAALADVAPIGAFILVTLFLVNRDVVGMPPKKAFVGTVLFVPYAGVLVPILNHIPFLRISNFYWTVPLLLVIYGVFLWRRVPQVARGLLIGAGILALSITVRSIDEVLCPAWPLGTHFGWHILNAIMLGWTIAVYRQHMRPVRG